MSVTNDSWFSCDFNRLVVGPPCHRRAHCHCHCPCHCRSHCRYSCRSRCSIFFALKGQLNSYCTYFFGAVLRQACATKVTKACLISPLDAFPVQLILSHTCHILHIFEFGNSFYLRLWVPNLADQPIFFSSAGWSAAQ